MQGKWLAAVLCVSIFAAGCGGGTDDAAPTNTVSPTLAPSDESTSSTISSTLATTTTTTAAPPTTTTTTTTTAAPLSDEEQILAVIEAYWRVVAVEAFDPPDPDPGLWIDIATIENTIRRVKRQQDRLDAGEGVSDRLPADPFVVASVMTVIEGDTAVAFVCVRDDAYLFELETRDVLAESSLISRKRTELLRIGAQWLVDRSSSEETFSREEEEACAASSPTS